MKSLTPFAMLLAVLATAVVGVCEQAEIRHYEYRVWELEGRRRSAERQILRLEAAARAARAPRVLLGDDASADPRPGDPWAMGDLGHEVDGHALLPLEPLPDLPGASEPGDAPAGSPWEALR
ncbi:MAG: hypothetical protein AB7T63_11575 [Planctomycetota bacterium]